MQNIQRFTRAYSQAPWRRQVHLIVLFMLILIFVTLVAGIYLNISARSGEIGRAIQALESEINIVKLNNEDLRIKLAFITSRPEMEKRARDLGFRPLNGDEMIYLNVPGYLEPQTPKLAQDPGFNTGIELPLAPEYTQSLFDWIREKIFKPASPLLEGQP
jgi:hypothetical protein